MDPIRSVCARLRSLAATLDGETARLQRALAGEDSDFEDYSMRILHDLHSEARTLKGDVNILLDKASLESQESIGFIKATKVLMKKNSADIIKIREFFQKYGYDPCAKKNPDESDEALHRNLTDPISTADMPLKDGVNRNRKGLGMEVDEQDVVDSKPESTKDETLQKPDVKTDLSDPVVPSSSVAEKIPCSPQLSDFGLERYLISQVPPIRPPAVNHGEEPETLTPSSKQSLVQVLKTPKCALNMDDFECETPKLEHFGTSEYTMCLNEDYTMGLRNMKNKSAEAVETEPVSSDSTLAGLTNQQLEKNDAGYTESPLAPTFCTPGLKIPSTNRTALQGDYFEKQNMETKLMSNGRGEDIKVSTDYPLLKTNSSSNDLEMEDCTTLASNSDKCLEHCSAPSSPVTSSHENLLRTPTPPKVTTIPEDILQVLLKYNPDLQQPGRAQQSVSHQARPAPDLQAAALRF